MAYADTTTATQTVLAQRQVARPMANALTERAMLVHLRVSQWTGRKFDADASNDVTARANASSAAARVTKALVDSAALKSVQTVANRARATHYTMTLPWAQDGSRVLPAAMFDKYAGAMRKLREEFEEAAAQFVADYDRHVVAARHTLGALFDEADYPTADEVASRFALRTTVMPLPDAGDFRVEMSAEAAAEVRASIEAEMAETRDIATRDLFERVREVTARVAERLAAYVPPTGDEKAKGVFRDSLIENARDLAALLPALNITGDARVNELADRLADIGASNPETLRANDSVRALVADEAQAIADQVADYLA